MRIGNRWLLPSARETTTGRRLLAEVAEMDNAQVLGRNLE